MTGALFTAIRNLVHESIVPPKAIADDAGIRYGYLLRAADENEDSVQFQARWVAPVTRAAKNDCLIKHLAIDCGGVFFRLNRVASMDAETSKSLKEFAEFIASVADAQDDQQTTPEEYHRVKAQAHESIAAILSHVEKLRIAAGVPE
jgi:hypothetical protein